jgi:hypothetical protein
MALRVCFVLLSACGKEEKRRKSRLRFCQPFKTMYHKMPIEYLKLTTRGKEKRYNGCFTAAGAFLPV